MAGEPKYIHDEWCASRPVFGGGECDCYVRIIKAQKARIEELEGEAALWRVLASPVWRGDESEGYFQCLCCNEIGSADSGAQSIKHTASCEYAAALARPKEGG